MENLLRSCFQNIEPNQTKTSTLDICYKFLGHVFKLESCANLFQNIRAIYKKLKASMKKHSIINLFEIVYQLIPQNIVKPNAPPPCFKMTTI